LRKGQQRASSGFQRRRQGSSVCLAPTQKAAPRRLRDRSPQLWRLLSVCPLAWDDGSTWQSMKEFLPQAAGSTFYERRLVDGLSSANVDKHAAGLHGTYGSGVNEAVRVRRVRQRYDHVVGSRHQVREPRRWVYVILAMGPRVAVNNATAHTCLVTSTPLVCLLPAWPHPTHLLPRLSTFNCSTGPDNATNRSTHLIYLCCPLTRPPHNALNSRAITPLPPHTRARPR
jgi:hypothetical protein